MCPQAVWSGWGTDSRGRSAEAHAALGVGALVSAPGPAEVAAQRCEEIDRLAGRWWVLHTRARNEKALASVLRRQRVYCYLPLVRKKRTYGGRTFEVAIPLFPGYVFMCGGENDRLAALQTKRVAKVIHVENQDELRAELQQVIRVVESGEPVDLYPGLCEGRRCRIIAGCLRGIEGVVLRRRSVSRLYMSATALGQSAVIEIDPALLEAVD